MLIESVLTIRNSVITGYGILGWKFVIDVRLGKGDISSSTISNPVKTGDGRLSWKFVIDIRLGKNSVMEAV